MERMDIHSKNEYLKVIRGKYFPARTRTPFEWKGVDTDNYSGFTNQILYKYCQRERLAFTRSRPNRKNDNAYIEEKNWTHVRKIFGYLRYDTSQELAIKRWLS